MYQDRRSTKRCVLFAAALIQLQNYILLTLLAAAMSINRQRLENFIEVNFDSCLYTCNAVKCRLADAKFCVIQISSSKQKAFLSKRHDS